MNCVCTRDQRPSVGGWLPGGGQNANYYQRVLFANYKQWSVICQFAIIDLNLFVNTLSAFAFVVADKRRRRMERVDW